jgi:uncharacterized protein (TIGR03435 family)
VRTIALTILALALGVSAAGAQTFEVASVKTAPPLDPQKIFSGQQRVGMKVAGSNVDIESVALPELLNLAFKVRPTQITGPDWLKSNDPLAAMSATRFNIHAKLPPGASEEQVPQMLQALLAERFKLTFHRDRKEQNAYALVIGKDGSKLEPSPPDDPKPADTPVTARPDPVQISGTPQTGLTIRGAGNAGTMTMQVGQDGTMRMVADKVTIEQLAASVERFVDRPVLDQTGLKGNYKMTLELSMGDMMAAARAAGVNVPTGAGGLVGSPAAGPADPGGGISIFKSVEKMGLKLEPRKSPVEYLVIDHLEKTPTED